MKTVRSGATMGRNAIGIGLAVLGLLLAAGAAQAQTTTFTYRELDRGSPTALARKTLGAYGEGFVRLRREEAGGMFHAGERYFTFAGVPTHSASGVCKVRRAHATYTPVERFSGTEPLNARLRLNDVWFGVGYRRLASPGDDGGPGYEARMNRRCAEAADVFDFFMANSEIAAGRALLLMDRLAADPDLDRVRCQGTGPCGPLLREVLAAPLHSVNEQSCVQVREPVGPGEERVCQTLRFRLAASPAQSRTGVLTIQFHETTDSRNQSRVRTIEAVSVATETVSE